MMRSDGLKNVAAAAGLAVVYFAAAKLGLQLASVHPSATAVWPCGGIALAALLVFGYRVWPGILIGAFLASLTTAGNVETSIGIAAANTLEGLAAWYLVNRFARGKQAFARAEDILKFALLAGVAATTIAATMAVATLAAAGFADWAAFGSMWSTWWLGDAAGVAMVTPLLLLWIENPRLHWSKKQAFELAALFAGMIATGWIVFSGMLSTTWKNYPVEYLCIPFLIWAAFRFGQREAATAVYALAGIGVWGTVHGFGTFSREAQNTSLLMMQGFLGIMVIVALAVAAEVSQHRQSEERARNLAVSDPLTGLANYRQLVEALETEIKRYGRTERPFVVLLLDLDGLKKINDAYGHVAGSRALCRLADMLRLYSREMDTAGRYGGDEFVLILPETDAEAARLVAQRISKRLTEDGEEPKITVSIGSAIFPDDGESLNEILGAADRDLYREKGVPKKRSLLPS
ncbi:MAG TPA: MASE1 domain-containing protein [Candidatus Micrarchaeia archaeon]|nr:MASE1 domain-containing protein [Candidatus Micrarchaeia archaeon]